MHCAKANLIVNSDSENSPESVYIDFSAAKLANARTQRKSTHKKTRRRTRALTHLCLFVVSALRHPSIFFLRLDWLSTLPINSRVLAHPPRAPRILLCIFRSHFKLLSPRARLRPFLPHTRAQTKKSAGTTAACTA